MSNPDHVAQPPPAVSSPSTSDAGTFRERVSCLYCGKHFARFCLAKHVRAKHADQVVDPTAPAKRRAARVARPGRIKAQSPVSGLDAAAGVAEAFDAAAKLLEDQGLMVVQCARGLTVLMGKVKALRKEYIKVRHELTRLQREASDFSLESEPQGDDR